MACRGEPIVGGSKGVCPLGRRARVHAPPEKGRQRAKRTLEGGSQFPLQVDLLNSKKISVKLLPYLAGENNRISYLLVNLIPKTTIPTRSPTSKITSRVIPKTFVFPLIWIRTILSSDSTWRLSAIHSVFIFGS